MPPTAFKGKTTPEFCATFVLFCAVYAEFCATPLMGDSDQWPWFWHMPCVHRGILVDLGTAQSSTKFTVLQILENSLETLRPARMPQCTHGIMSESATRSMAQSSAYTAQNSTKVAQNSRCFRPVKIPSEHLGPLECQGVHMAYVRVSHKGRGTKFGVCGTKQHKSSTKFWCGFTLESCCWQANLT